MNITVIEAALADPSDAGKLSRPQRRSPSANPATTNSEPTPIGGPVPTQVPTTSITVREGANARQGDLDTADLERSIKHIGIIIPLIVREHVINDEPAGYELVAGHRRLAAAINLGLDAVPVEIRADLNGEHEKDAAAVAAVENVVRTNLTPYEEAIALDAVLKRGYTEKGAADLLGWTRKRVTERARLLELPERARALFDGRVSPTLVQDLQQLQRATKLFDTILQSYEKDEIEHDSSPVEEARAWAWGDPNAVECWPIGRYLTPETLGYDDDSAQAARWTAIKEASTYYISGYYPTEKDVDNARAADCLLELGDDPHIIDRAFVNQLFDDYMKQLEDKQAGAKDDRPAADRSKEGPVDPEHARQVAWRRCLRELYPVARGANLDLANEFMGAIRVPAGLEKADKPTADLLVDALLSHMPDKDGAIGNYGYSDAYKRWYAIAARLALCVPELRTEEQKVLKSGKVKTTVGFQDKDTASAWLRKWMAGAKSDQPERIRRALVAAAIAHNASLECLPKSQAWSLHNPFNQVQKDALHKLTVEHTPGSVKALRRAVQKAVTDTGMYYTDGRGISYTTRKPKPAKARTDKAAEGGR